MVTGEGDLLDLQVSSRVASFVEIPEINEGWTADFRQLDRGLFQSNIFQTQLGSILVTGGHLGCNVNQRGSQPPGLRCFAVQEESSPEMLWYGHTSVGVTLSVIWPHQTGYWHK